jgi:cytochrome P450
LSEDSGSRPPGPLGRFGNQRAYQRDRIGFLLRNQREYGDVFSFSDVSTVVLDPALIQQLHARTNAEFASEVSMFSGKGRFERLLSTIPTTMAARRKGWRGVNRSASARHAARLVDAFDRVMKETGGREVDANDVMMRVAGFAVADFAFGGDGRDVAPIVDAVDRAVRATQVLMDRPYRLPSWLATPGRVRMRRGAQGLREAIADHVAARWDLPPEDGPRDLLDVFLDSSPGDPEHVHMPLNLMLRAGYGAPGAALTWAARQLATHPEHARALRDEAESLGDPTVAERPLAEAFVKEVLRMYPPSWLGGREVAAPAELGGWRFEAGEQVMFSPYVVHRDPRWWDRPEEFLPERWEGPDSPYARHAYIPFGAGPRICIGNQLAMMELTLNVSRLAHRYDIELANPDVPMVPQTILRPLGLRAIFAPV